MIYASTHPPKNGSSEDSGGLLLGKTQDTGESLTVEDINTVYYLKGDNTRMYLAGSDTAYVRFHEPKKVYVLTILTL